MGKLADLKCAEGKGRDIRIFPGVYAKVIVSDGGKLSIKPMRYQSRLADKLVLPDTDTDPRAAHPGGA